MSDKTDKPLCNVIAGGTDELYGVTADCVRLEGVLDTLRGMVPNNDHGLRNATETLIDWRRALGERRRVLAKGIESSQIQGRCAEIDCRNRYGGAECRHSVSLERRCQRCEEILGWHKAGEYPEDRCMEPGQTPEAPQLWGA